MSIVLMILLCGIIGAASIAGTVLLYRYKTYGIGPKEKFSWPSYQIMKKYNELPDDHRPFADLKEILVAIDTKHGIGIVNSHFTAAYSSSIRTWNCGTYGTGKCIQCVYNEYHQIRGAISEVEAALKMREKTLAMSKVRHGLDSIGQLTADLRRERDLINQVTRELS